MGDDAVRNAYQHRTPFYEVVISTSPARIQSLRVDPSGTGNYLGVVNNFGPKGSAPFASYGSRLKWHEDHAFEAGRPERVLTGPEYLRLERVPVGPHGLEVTWEFRFRESEFLMEFTWLAASPQHGLWEAGWKLDSSARHIGDARDIDAPPGYRGPYRSAPRAWVAWWEDDPRYQYTLVAAHVRGSADRGDGIYLEASSDRPVSWGAWLAISCPGGIDLPAGSCLAAGQWRVAASTRPADAEYAVLLADGRERADDERAAREVYSDRELALRWGSDHLADLAVRQPGAERGTQPGARPVARRGSDGSWVLTDGSIAAAFVPADGAHEGAHEGARERGHYKLRCYVRPEEDWSLALCGAPDRRYVDVQADGDGDGLVVQAESFDAQGRLQSRSTEQWSIRDSPPRLHVDSTDTLAAPDRYHGAHSYLVYPDGRSKLDLGAGRSYDTLIGPHLRPQADLVMGQHAMRSPAVGVQHGDSFAALVPDLLIHRQHGNYGVELSPRHFGLYLNLDVADRLVDAAIISFGWRTMEWTYSLWRVEEGYFCRALAEPAPRETVRTAYDLVLAGGSPPQGVLAQSQRLLWSTVGHRYFEQSTLPQTQPADMAFADAWSWGRSLYQGMTIAGRRVGAVRVDREFPPDAMFMSWFNALRTSYGIASNGHYRADPELAGIGRSTLSLLLSAPNDRGAFPTIAHFGPERIDWYGAHKNFANQMPWGPGSYSTFDMSWTAYWLLRWHQDLGPEPAALEFATRYGDFLLSIQLASGAVPSWVRMADLKVDPHLRESAQTASSLLFLAELALVTEDKRYREAAQLAAGYVVENHVRCQRWDDFEVYYSNAPKSEGAADPLTGMSAQDTLSMHFAAAGLLALARATGEERWIDEGQRALDQMLQYQAVWPASFLSLYTFGGFSVQNTDQEWNDARQAQIAPTLLDYARATGREDYAERGIAALRASYATMCTPSAEAINPRYFDYQPLGWANENYAHNPYDAPTTPVPTPHFDWGCGAALAAFAEVRNRFGDVWVDLDHGTAHGIDDVMVRSFSWTPALLVLDLESPSSGRQVILKVDGAPEQELELRVNGISLGAVSRDDLVRGIRVPSRHRGRVVHNPWRITPPTDGVGVVIPARVIGGVSVQAARLHYRSDGRGWQASGMTQISADQWSGTIPAAAVVAGCAVEYYISVSTEAGTLHAPEVDPAIVPFRREVQ